LVWLLLGIGGCASEHSKAADPSQPHAECLVCKRNADLACVDVAVDAQTPHVDHDGQTYYFCSEECKKAFEKNPAKYLSK
jgi:YHS domain-containing protein